MSETRVLRRYTKELEVELDDNGVRRKGMELASKHAERGRLERAFKSQKKTHDARVKKIDQEIDVLADEVREGRGHVEATIEERLWPAERRVEIVRTDCDPEETISGREASREELQGKLFEDPPADPSDEELEEIEEDDDEDE